MATSSGTDMIANGLLILPPWHSRMSKQTGRGPGHAGTKTRRVCTRAGTPVHNTHIFRGRGEGVKQRGYNEFKTDLPGEVTSLPAAAASSKRAPPRCPPRHPLLAPSPPTPGTPAPTLATTAYTAPPHRSPSHAHQHRVYGQAGVARHVISWDSYVRFVLSFLEYMPSCDVESMGMARPAACARARALHHRALNAKAAVAVARSIVIPRSRVVGTTTRPTLKRVAVLGVPLHLTPGQTATSQ